MTVIKELSNNKLLIGILTGAFCWGVWASKSIIEIQYAMLTTQSIVGNIEESQKNSTEINAKQNQLLFELDTRLKIQEQEL